MMVSTMMSEPTELDPNVADYNSAMERRAALVVEMNVKKDRHKELNAVLQAALAQAKFSGDEVDALLDAIDAETQNAAAAWGRIQAEIRAMNKQTEASNGRILALKLAEHRDAPTRMQ